MLSVRGALSAAVRLGPVRAPSGAARRLHSERALRSAGGSGKAGPASGTPDPALLDLLVCPLSKKPLRYEASTNELINEELGIAYPIIDGIPNMIPQAARMIQQTKTQEAKEKH